MNGSDIERLSAREIRQLRTKLGMTQLEFSMLVGVDRVTVGRWETGERHPHPSACRLMRRLEEEQRDL